MSFIPNPPPPEISAGIPPSAESPAENPPFSGWDVLLLAVIFFISINILVALALVVALRLHMDGITAQQLAANRGALKILLEDARFLLPTQLAAYAILLGFMAVIVRTHARRGFLEGVRWRWPSRSWPNFILAGALLALVVSMATEFLPIPKSLPVDQFFRDATSAYLMSAFGILVAPFMEELFFRGFLYPVLARRIGILLAIVLTAIAFALVHGAQLGYAWAPLLMLFIVGGILTLIRARTRSVASSVLLHIGYNATLFAVLYVGTNGFRHLQRP